MVHYAPNLPPSNVGPLHGVNIVDLTSVLMGPYATQILGDLGADVITIEQPTGDPCRAMGPGPGVGMSGVALNLMRNKRSAVLDIGNVSDRPTIEGLLRWADVFVTNLRPEPLRRAQLDFTTAQRINPSLIYCQAQGWATDSPEQYRPAYDDIIQTATGVADLMNRATGQKTLFPSVIADKIRGQTICTAVLAALFHCARTGQGQHVEVPMYDTMLDFQLVEHLAGATTEPPLSSAGYGRLTTPHRGPRQAIDGAITLMPYTNHQWHGLFCAVGDDAAIQDPRFATPEGRAEHADALYARLGPIIAVRIIAEIVNLCEPLGIAVQQLRTLDQTIDDALGTGQLRVAQHPLHGSYRIRQPAVRFSKTPQRIRRHAPTVGEHTSEVRSVADRWNEVPQT